MYFIRMGDFHGKEIEALNKNKIWSLVDAPPNVNLVSCKLVYWIKWNQDRTLQWTEARLVAQGLSQMEGVDFVKTYSPILKFPTIYIILALDDSKDWCIRQLDVDNGFLNRNLKKAIYMVQPSGFACQQRTPFESMPSPQIFVWFTSITTSMVWSAKWLLVHYWVKNTCFDSSLFYWHTSSSLLFMLIYIDDIVVTGSSTSEIQGLIDRLSLEFKLKDTGKLQYFLGMKFLKCSNTSKYIPSQQRYTCDILKSTNMHQANLTYTPMVYTTMLNMNDGAPFDDKSLYRSTMGGHSYT